MTVPTEKTKERTKALALQLTLEWLEHPNFKPRVKGSTFMESVTLGRTYLAIAEETNHNEYDVLYKAAKQRWHDAINEASSLGWLHIDQRTVGRPRTKDYESNEIANAFRRLRFMRPSELERRDERITGGPQRTVVSIVTVQETIWRDLLTDITAEALTGNSKADLIEALELPQRSASCFWRWLLRNGWKQKRLRHPDGSRSYVIVQRESE